MTVLVLGAAGFIGPHVVRALAEAADVGIVAASRSGAGPHGTALDRRDIDAVVALVRERRIEAVIDLLAYTRADTLPLLERLARRVGRYVLASSADVYRNYEGLHRRAAPTPLAGPLAEASPLRRTRRPYRERARRPRGAADAWLDDYDKIPLEAALRSGFGEAGTILRLPMVFGPGDRQRRFGWILKSMLGGKERLTVDPAWAAWRTTYGYVADVGAAVAAAALHPAAGGRTFNLGEADPADHAAWVARFAQVLSWRGEVVLAPAPAMSPIADLDLAYTLVLDTSAFRQACGWREPTPMAKALLRTVEDERARG
jgi:nucleoside-diphosphate-sugar epimerase